MFDRAFRRPFVSRLCLTIVALAAMVGFFWIAVARLIAGAPDETAVYLAASLAAAAAFWALIDAAWTQSRLDHLESLVFDPPIVSGATRVTAPPAPANDRARSQP